MFNITGDRISAYCVTSHESEEIDPPALSTVGRFTERYPVHTVSFSSRVPGEAPALRHANLSGCPAHTYPCWRCSHQNSNKASRHILSVYASRLYICTYHVGILALVSTSRAVSTRIRRRPHSAECGTATYRTDPSVPVSLTESSEVLAGSVCHSQLIPDGISPFPTSLPGHSSLYQERCPSPVCAHTKLPHKS